MQDFIFEELNFIPKDEINHILNKIISLKLDFKKSEYNINGRNLEFHNFEELNPFSDFINNYKQKIKDRISKYFQGFKVETFEQNFLSASVLLTNEGGSTPLHTDDQYDQGVLRSVGVLIYLNDLDSGGELAFPLQKRVIKPEAGKIIIFPTSFTHPHFVFPTIKDRYVLRLNYGMEL